MRRVVLWFSRVRSSELRISSEVAIGPIAPGGDLTAWVCWPAKLTPPATVGGGAPWRPHLLVEVTPLDGPRSGAAIHENNNLAQKAVAFAP